MPSGTNAGPGIWCFGNFPDRHAFRGSYGGYAFPLHDRRHGPDAHNLSPPLLEELSAAYGRMVSPQEVFDAILCLLSAFTYTLRFAEDLEDTFPHVPFPASPETFAQAARLGAEIRAVETFSRPSAPRYRDVCRLETEPRGPLASVECEDGALVLCADGSGRLTGLPEHVWRFSVSGYRVLPRWLEARVGQPVDLALVNEIGDICGRIAELIDLFAAADTVLDAALVEPLMRGALDAR